jgi:hypothetical protein
MARRKTLFGQPTWLVYVGVILVFGIVAYGVMTVAVGLPVYTADDYLSVAAYDAAGTAVTVSAVDADQGVLEFTLAAAAAKIQITYDFTIDDMLKNGVSQLNIDIRGLETLTFDLIKVYLSDGTTNILLGKIYDDEVAKSFEIEEDDLETLSDFQDAQLYLWIYDDTGALTNAYEAKEHNLVTDFTRAGGISNAAGLLSAGIISIIATVRKVIVGITSAIAAFFTALVTNEVILIFMVGLAVVLIYFFIAGKKAWRY